ncbi:MAG: cation-translocating P-type ATPase [Oligoflexia bacterium]|nr:cation-translocating P-type ATPase [Oligoflexia bacterium]
MAKTQPFSDLNSFPSLTFEQANQLQKQWGLNELPDHESKSLLAKIIGILREPMLLLLVGTSGFYYTLGDFSEGLLLSFSVLIVLAISLFQELRSERALEALRQLSSPRALVIRNGVASRIPARELVPGDLVSINEGDRVPADGTVLWVSHLHTDESLLTGESFSVRKSLGDSVFSSTLVQKGRALMTVKQTGIHTEVGKIGKTLQAPTPPRTHIQFEVRRLVKAFAWIGLFVCIVIVVAHGWLTKNWVEALLVGLATQIALLPEEFPVILTVFLAIGAWRLSRQKVLVRVPGSIEALGSVSVLCVDKTGTLTKNQMAVQGLWNRQESLDLNLVPASSLPENHHQLIEYGVLASHVDPFDPMEKAIRTLVSDSTWGRDHLHPEWELVREYPLSDELLAMSCVWKNRNDPHLTVASKGAPEAIINLCHLDESHCAEILQQVHRFAAQGLRVLGVARSRIQESSEIPADHHALDFEFLGLIALADPLREEVPDAVRLTHAAGIRVIMLTGDYPETALRIAEQAGLSTEAGVLTGDQLRSMGSQEFKAALSKVCIFSRVKPDQKLQIVMALKELGHCVAMTGDGVNDAPSLKWADVGIAMGNRGPDTAREASDLVLLDDNFASIVHGIERGRMIFHNMRRALGFASAVHIPIAGLSIVPAVLGWPLILFPAHIVFLELIIDPACSLMFESAKPRRPVMELNPRPLTNRLFDQKELIKALLKGLLATVVIILYGRYWTDLGATTDQVRTLSFGLMVFAVLSLLISDLTEGSLVLFFQQLTKPVSAAVFLGTLSFLTLIIEVPQLRKIFHFSALDLNQYKITLIPALILLLIYSAWDFIGTSHQKS